MPEGKLRDALYRWRVRSAVFVLVGVIVAARPNLKAIIAGACVSALGLLIRAWASGHIRKEKTLAVTGPYRYSRNPLYLGNFFLGLGIALGTRSFWGYGLFLAYFAVFYPPVILEERERMRRLFPREYDLYRRTVPLFFPSFRSPSPKGDVRWSLDLYRRNGEYRALVGALAVWAVFTLKMVLR
ncbi:MAG: isoprenylcysteine carboxylmethyltransferase family protein [Candidatus Aminicenantes bacterium]|nr:isoprenylcysteine carboxylmethyltransferase family protein [Candidatus Aminicenantes bacterium]